jgi:hypothetical protein
MWGRQSQSPQDLFNQLWKDELLQLSQYKYRKNSGMKEK